MQYVLSEGFLGTHENHLLLQVKKAGKLLPNNPKILNDLAPGRSKKLSAARNTQREGGFGAGQPYQKAKAGIPSEPPQHHTPDV